MKVKSFSALMGEKFISILLKNIFEADKSFSLELTFSQNK